MELVPVFEIINSTPPLEIQKKPQPMEVVKYSFSMEELKIGDFLPVAVLEHTKDGNLVHLINENVQPQTKLLQERTCKNSLRFKRIKTVFNEIPKNFITLVKGINSSISYYKQTTQFLELKTKIEF